jgi:membrane fusion protein (multidrug efflux system)
MKNITNITLALLMTAGAATLQNCGSSNAREEEEKKESPAAEVSTDGFILEKGQLSSNLQIPGELIAFQQVDLYAKVSSFVKKLHVDVGSEVKQGQLLASMEAPELTSQYISSTSKLKAQEAVYMASKASYDRLLETSKTPGTVSQNDLDLALAKQNSDLAQLEAARSASKEISDTRNYLEIRAPFSGVISARNVSAGAYVGPSGKGSEMPLFTLVEQRKLRLVVSVPEAYTSYLNSNSTVSFKVKALPNENFPAKVARLSGALDTRLRAQRVEMDVLNNDKRLLPGMIAEVAVPLSRGKDSFIVPKSAVLNSSQGTFLIKVQDQKAVWVPVKAGATADNKTEIFGDVREGDVFIKTVTEEIRDNSEVKNVKTTAI